MSYVTLLPLFVLGVACATLGIAFWSHRWPRARGVVETSIFDVEWEAEGSGSRVSVEKRGRFYLAYAYSVGGREFRASRIAPLVDFDWYFTGSPQLGGARDRSMRYREGAPVDVSYCPIWPRWSCLEPGGFGAAFLLAAVAAILFALV